MSTEKFVEQLFQTYLGRPSQTAGKAYWVKQIDQRFSTAAEVTLGFMESAEYTSTVSSIVQLYFAAFGRIPRIEGLQFWVNQLKAGATIHQISTEFVNSAEFQTIYNHLTTPESYFEQLFQNIFQRPPTEAGTTFWVNAYQQGTSLAEIVRTFSASDEFKALHDKEIQVTLHYFGVLETQPSRSELSDALQKNDPIGLITQLYASDQYKGEAVPFLIKNGTVIANGVVEGATVFIDQNNDQVLNEGELSTTTDKTGHWSFEGKGTFTGRLVTFGGIDKSTSQEVRGTTTVEAGTVVIKTQTNVLTSSLRYTTGSVPPLEENTITVAESHTLRIFSTFNQSIQTETIPVISINNGTNELIKSANMVRISDITYYYDLNVPAGDFIGTVSINTKALKTGKTVPVTTSNTSFEVDNPPVISSGNTVVSIAENSGDNQVIYKATSDDPNSVYSLKNTADRDFFSIDATTGQVTLLKSPDFEKKPSYDFTVIATDQSGHQSNKIIKLSIIEIDEVSPTVLGVSSTVENGHYKTGDVIPITITFDEIIAVTGTPTLSLKIGNTEKVVNYTSGAGTTVLAFNYIVEANDATKDLGYLSTAALKLNGGTINDSFGNKAVLTLASPASEGSLSTNKTIVIDNVFPTLKTQNPLDKATKVAVGSNLVFTFDEKIALGSGVIKITSGSDTKTIDVKENASQLSIDGKILTINPSSDLAKGQAVYQIDIQSGAVVDLAGNPYLGSTSKFTTAVNTNIVVFDLVAGKNSSHSEQIFKNDIDYQIFIRVNSNSADLATANTQWTGGHNLGEGDVITLVGNGKNVLGFHGKGVLSQGKVTKLNGKIEWATALQNNKGTATKVGNAMVLFKGGAATRSFSGAKNDQALWTGGVDIKLIGKQYNTNIQAGILTSQGLI